MFTNSTKTIDHCLRAWIAIAIVICAAHPGGYAQTPYFNLDAISGLPSNHIYYTLTDQNGYFWVATPNGVARYNGYETRVFTVNDGLPTEDIWCLLEDQVGRLWLSNISNEVGYIRNGRYYTALRDPKNFIYPVYTGRYSDGIALFNKGAVMRSTKKDWECIICNSSGSKKISTATGTSASFFIDQKGNIVASHFNKKLYFQKGRIQEDQLVWDSTLYVPDETEQLALYRSKIDFLNDNVFFTTINGKQCRVLNLNNRFAPHNINPLDKKETISFAYARDNLFYLLGSENAYLYDSTLRLLRKYTLASLSGGDIKIDHNLKSLEQYPLWGTVLGTFDRGLYFSDQEYTKGFGKRSDIHLSSYRFLGITSDTSGLWYSSITHTLRLIGPGGRLLACLSRVPDIHMMANDRERTLLFTDADTYTLRYNGKGKLSTHRDASLSNLRVKAAVVYSDTLLYISGGAYYHLSRITPASQTILMQDYYRKMVFDRTRYGVWLYRNQQIAFYNIKENSFRVWYPATLKKMGLRKIESIVIDEQYGNLVIKDYDQLFLFDDKRNTITPLLTGYRYGDAHMAVNGSRLIIAGRLGLMWSDILGHGKFGAPSVVENFKNCYYNIVYGLQVIDSTAILNTDKGVYDLSLSGAAFSKESAPTTYHFIAATYDTTRRIANGDTLSLQAGTATFQLDVINPHGNGRLRLAGAFSLKEKWAELTGREVNINTLAPGRYHRFYLFARDEVWQSKTIMLVLYIQPYWWQTTAFFLTLICAGVVLTFFIILVTRRIVLRQQARQRMMLEMQMAGIHAQINPHFIFNSLTTTQYFIKANKIKQAYEHINRFSRLLRNFLQASRHKYITISEEIDHLRNYIELQQSRFEEQFEYRIDMGPNVAPALMIPSLLLQPLVENAIQHGLFHKKTPGLLLLSFSKEDDRLVIEIDDDGIGREQARALQLQEPARTSFGSDLVNKLVLLFNKYEHIKIDLVFIDKIPPQTGTTVKITIHYPPA
ncbi:histidine kinase [Taibaiella koreensis]|uniref:histidine kinase n=1 Tax=Taibaiella koreensis TaxID=1268548 RepID=UPI000E59BA5B|nr:histidine kinase [Taibaiella koreensis]